MLCEMVGVSGNAPDPFASEAAVLETARATLHQTPIVNYVYNIQQNIALVYFHHNIQNFELKFSFDD